MEEKRISPQDLVGQDLLNDALKFGETVKHLRMAAKWNQDDLADRIGVTRQTISSIENGSARPSKTIGIALSAVFKEYQRSVEPSDLFNIISENTGWSKASTGLLGGSLGWSLGGPIGAILGVTAGVAIKQLKKDKKTNIRMGIENMQNNTITISDLETVVGQMKLKYAIVNKQIKDGDTKEYVFIKVDGQELSKDIADVWTIEKYRELHQGESNAIIYNDVDKLELIIQYPNEFQIHALCNCADTESKTGFELGIKYKKSICFNNPITDDILIDIELTDLPTIATHVMNLDVGGHNYISGFKPDSRYNIKLDPTARYMKKLPKRFLNAIKSFV